MSDEHEDLARRQEREVADLQEESDELVDEIEGAKADVAKLESMPGIATPDPAIEGSAEDADSPAEGRDASGS